MPDMSMVATFSLRLLRVLGDLCAPPLCPLCRTELTLAEACLCEQCESNLPHLSERRCGGCGGSNPGLLALCPECLRLGGRPWELAVAAFPFHGFARDAVLCFKYRHRTSLSPFLAERMVNAWRQLAPERPLDAVVPIPLHWLRLWQRGYNQAQLLSSQVARQLQVPEALLLRRVRYTRQQARLNMAQRQKNIRRAFALRSGAVVANQHLLLIDDVFTTGSTLAAATEILLRAKAASVSILTVARD